MSSEKTKLSKQVNLGAWLLKPVNAYYLFIFRILFSMVMLLQFAKHFVRANDYDQSGVLRFYYHGFSWIPHLSGSQFRVLLCIGILAALLSALGILFRYSITAVFLISAYIQLSDALYYNNHYYFFALLCFLLAFTDADQGLSANTFFNKRRAEKYVPNWQLLILQLMVFIVYFYGGLAKLNGDWLCGQITRFMFPALENETLALLIAWSGMLFDLFIGFLLFYPKTRVWAVIAVILFNLTNGLVFFEDIQLFPLAMIAASLLFVPGDWWEKIFETILAGRNVPKKKKGKSISGKVKTNPGKPVFVISPGIKWGLVLFFGFQFLWPFRHHLAPGHVDWTGQGHYMAWRMKSYYKDVSFSYSAFDSQSGELIESYGNLGLSPEAEQRIGAFPFLVWQLGQEIKRQLSQNGIDSQIRVEYLVEFNGRDKAQGIDPNTDIGSVDFHPWKKNNWIPDLTNQ